MKEPSLRERLGPLAQLSPLRHTSGADTLAALVEEQLEHFGIRAGSEHGRALAALVERLYQAHGAAHELWSLTSSTLAALDRADRIAWFNAKRFACFQLAKVLDTLQNPLRATYQSLVREPGIALTKGPFPLFDNVAAIFSATPVIARTATYLYACAEWIEDAFRGQEQLHDIYSRLMNPTSISLANHIIDLEAGAAANEYFAWNFNSGMAAIDATLAHLLGQGDVVLASRHLYGGTYQLLHDWYAASGKFDIRLEWFDGASVEEFEVQLTRVYRRHADRFRQGRRLFIYLESPCNPHGYVLDVPAISRLAHAHGLTVICDATIATPFLQPTLRRADPRERPDFVIHSYTKDLAGSGATIAGVVIARNERMFIPKGQSVRCSGHDGVEHEYSWNQTLFWSVYYIKGAFLDADRAFEVLGGMRTLELRMLVKCINTLVLARALARHPLINVNCCALDTHPNASLRRQLMTLALPAPLFTIDFERLFAGSAAIHRPRLKRFLDNLEPAFGLQVSLGQMNTLVLCPALTTHSELSGEALRRAGISASTVRISVGGENPLLLIEHLMDAATRAFGDLCPELAAGFPAANEVRELYENTYLEVHRAWIRSRLQ